MSVSLSVRISQKSHAQFPRYFMYMLPVAAAQSWSNNSAVCYVFPFVVDSRFSIICQAKVTSAGYIHSDSTRHQGAAPGRSLMSTVA